MDNKAYVESQKTCPLYKTDACVYNTQGKYSCNGPVTQGAEKQESVKQTVTDHNTQLFQRFMDERFSWK
jgi:hypothetical protein